MLNINQKGHIFIILSELSGISHVHLNLLFGH